jgi:tetratricopeptide (TPR) repeat protein
LGTTSCNRAGGIPLLAFLAIFSLSFWLPSGIAQARGRKPPAAYDSHLKAARKHYAEKEYDKAIERFEKAYKAYPDPKLFFNIAQSHRLLGHDREALENYRNFLAAIPTISEFDEEKKQNLTTEVGKKIRALEESLKPAEEPVVATPEPDPPAVTVKDPAVPAAPVAPAGLSSRWWFWTGTGVTAALVMGTVWAGLKAKGYNDDWEADRIVRDHDQAVKYQNLTDLFLLGAVTAGVGVAVTSYLFHRKASRIKGTTSNVSLLPGCGHQGCTLTLSWEF